MQLMAIDYGEKRVGIASTDETGRFALPRLVLPSNAGLVDEVVKLIKEWQIERVVIGESKNFQGEDNLIMKEARAFAEKLRERGVDVVYHPEVLTSAEAAQLQGVNDMLDASAAAIILKSFLDIHHD